MNELKTEMQWIAFILYVIALILALSSNFLYRLMRAVEALNV